MSKNRLRAPLIPAAPAKPPTAVELEQRAIAELDAARERRAKLAQSELNIAIQAICQKYGAVISCQARAGFANGGAVQVDTPDFNLVVQVRDLPAVGSSLRANGDGAAPSNGNGAEAP